MAPCYNGKNLLDVVFMRVGINGFGRIGRILLRANLLRAHAGEPACEIVGINDTSPANTMAHLLKYDSAHGPLPLLIKAQEGQLICNETVIPLSHTRIPEEIPWKKWGVNLVLECTGAFKTADTVLRHFRQSDVKKVLVSAPAQGVDLTAVFGVNHTQYDKQSHNIVSNASCTTNCLAPIAMVLHKQFGIVRGFMNTVHSYTNDQSLLDRGHGDLRRARAGAESIIPTTTGAAKTVGVVLPDLKGRLDGISVRVPTPNVSLVDFVAQSEREVSVDAINEALVEAANGELNGVLCVEGSPLVSRDFMGHAASSIVDLPSTMVLEKKLFRVMSWYDNEMGFSHRMIDMSLYMMSA